MPSSQLDLRSMVTLLVVQKRRIMEPGLGSVNTRCLCVRSVLTPRWNRATFSGADRQYKPWTAAYLALPTIGQPAGVGVGAPAGWGVGTSG
jgi:hypothetical protein